MFQCEVTVEAPDGSPVFSKRLNRVDLPGTDEAYKQENEMLPMLYRRRVEFVIGHKIAVHAAVVRAAKRGVRITVVVETPDKLDVQNEYSTIQALGEDVARCSTVYYWPKENRKADGSGKLGILHVKCAVGDGNQLFLSSANLTKYAFSLNMELGVLITGGRAPGQTETVFQNLIIDGILAKL